MSALSAQSTDNRPAPVRLRNRERLRRLLFAAVLFSAGLSANACQHEGLPSAPSQLTAALQIQDFLSSVVPDSGTVAARTGLTPAAGGGPTVTPTGNQVVINGGTSRVSLSATAPFDTVYVFMGARTAGLASGGPGGIDGYYELHLPSRQSTQGVVLSFAQTLAISDFELLFAVADGSGPWGRTRRCKPAHSRSVRETFRSVCRGMPTATSTST